MKKLSLIVGLIIAVGMSSPAEASLGSYKLLKEAIQKALDKNTQRRAAIMRGEVPAVDAMTHPHWYDLNLERGKLERMLQSYDETHRKVVENFRKNFNADPNSFSQEAQQVLYELIIRSNSALKPAL